MKADTSCGNTGDRCGHKRGDGDDDGDGGGDGNGDGGSMMRQARCHWRLTKWQPNRGT